MLLAYRWVFILLYLISSGCINGMQRLDSVLNPKPLEVENSSDVDKAIEEFRGFMPSGQKNIIQEKDAQNPDSVPHINAVGRQKETKSDDVSSESGDGSGEPEDISGEKKANDNSVNRKSNCNYRLSNEAGLFPNATFFQKMQEAAACPKDNERVSYYVHAGIALSDELCSVWFERLGKAQAKVNADRDILSNVGALTGTILGFTGAGSAAAGGAAAGFGFLENSFDSELANFIVAPDISEVQEAIDTERKSRALALEAKLVQNKMDFYQARTELIRYDNTCSHLAVKRKVNESVGNATQKTKKQIEEISATVFDAYVNAKKTKVEADERLAKAIDEKEKEEGREALIKAEKERAERVAKENTLIEKANEKLKVIFQSINPSKKVKDLKISQIIAFYVRLNPEVWGKLGENERDINYKLINKYLFQNGLDELSGVAVERIKTALKESDNEGNGWLKEKIKEIYLNNSMSEK